MSDESDKPPETDPAAKLLLAVSRRLAAEHADYERKLFAARRQARIMAELAAEAIGRERALRARVASLADAICRSDITNPEMLEKAIKEHFSAED